MIRRWEPAVSRQAPPTHGDHVFAYQNAVSSVGLACAFPSCFFLIPPRQAYNLEGDLEDTREMEILDQRVDGRQRSGNDSDRS